MKSTILFTTETQRAQSAPPTAPASPACGWSRVDKANLRVVIPETCTNLGRSVGQKFGFPFRAHSRLTCLIFLLSSLVLNHAASLRAQTNTLPASGNVGIGTTSPGSFKLNVQSSTSADVFFGGAQSASLTFGNQNWPHIIGIDSSNRFYFKTNGINYFMSSWDGSIIQIGPTQGLNINNGNIGIGTMNPVAPLHVNTPGAGTAWNGLLLQPSLSNGNYAQIVLGRSTATSDSATISFVPNATAASSSLRLGLYNSSDAFSISGNGNVGIGTSNPATKLDVSGVTRVMGSTGASTGSGMELAYVANDGGYITPINRDTVARTKLYLDGSSLLLNANSGGNVGIGTTNATYPLTVNGAVRAKEVIVDTGWSDYVFEKSYRLAPLSEVEQRINEDHHLPGIPSAQEVTEKGISVGQMQAKLLAKMEEMTRFFLPQRHREHRATIRVLHPPRWLRPLVAGAA